ncbi:MAG: sorting protein [Caulobacteraceae bacterium]|nr:sorting protein [Caulobacteraceae bacterium]
MRIRNALLATVALAASVAAVPALAATPTIFLSSYGTHDVLKAGEQMVADFNDETDPTKVLLPGYSLTLNGATVGVDEGMGGYSGTLYQDLTHYLTIATGTTAELTSTKGITGFSFYMGSPDTYNWVQFIGAGYNETIGGAQLSGDPNQSWDWGQRVNVSFGGAKIDKIIFSSTSNSFETDSFAVSAAPEPASWAMMIVGFGLTGAMVRRRRMALAVA